VTLRVGLAGAGWVSGHHLDAWAELADRARVVAIADPRTDAAHARAAQYGIAAVHDSVEAMLEHTDLDAIDIAAPRELHVPIARMAARRGLAILCQKPLAPTLAEAEAFADGLDPRVRFMVHENWRFRPHYRRVHEWLRQDRVGEPRTVLLSVLSAGLIPDADGVLPALARQPMLAALDRMLLMEILIHHVDALRFLFGPLTLDSARLGHSCDAILGEDRAALALRTAGGAAVSLIGDFMAHGQPPVPLDRIEIYGTRGAITLHDDRLSLLGDVMHTERVDLAENYRASYRGAIGHFVERLRDGRPFETSIADNLETLRIVDAAYRWG
jgi:predicted dehydrogenase